MREHSGLSSLNSVTSDEGDGDEGPTEDEEGGAQGDHDRLGSRSGSFARAAGPEGSGEKPVALGNVVGALRSVRDPALASRVHTGIAGDFGRGLGGEAGR